MRTKHKKIYDALFDNPVRANIHMDDIEALFIALGAKISYGRGSRIRVVLNGVRGVFYRPHPEKEAHKALVRSIRRFLIEADTDELMESMEYDEDDEDVGVYDENRDE